MYENILFEKKDGVAYLTLNRPDRLNALNSAVLKELDDALAAIDGDAEIRVLVVRGAGEKALAAGADITEMQSMEAEDRYGLRCLWAKGIRQDRGPAPALHRHDPGLCPWRRL